MNSKNFTEIRKSRKKKSSYVAVEFVQHFSFAVVDKMWREVSMSIHKKAHTVLSYSDKTICILKY